MQWDIPVSSPFPSFPVTVFSLISYLFYLVAHYIAKRFCIEKKYRIIIFFIPPCNENICAPLQKFREDLTDRPLHCPQETALARVSESVCANVWLRAKRVCLCSLRLRTRSRATPEAEGKYDAGRCALFSEAALERERGPSC